LLRRHQSLPATELIEVLKRALADYYPGSHPEDDITLLILERKLE
jgi:serine phosphatase RsbU (regulator of sigma subunit)